MVLSKSGLTAGLLIKENPWYRIGMSRKSHYVATPPPWMGDRSRCSAAQIAAQEAFAAVASASIGEYPADGSMSTNAKRVKSIGRQLRGKMYTSAEKLRQRLPKSATADHPIAMKLRGLGAKL